MKRKLTYDNLITIIFLVILLVTLIYNLIFQDGNKIARILLAITATIVTKIFFSITFLKKSKASYVASILFIILSMYFGNIINFYEIIPNYDKILHLGSGIIMGFVGIVIYAYFTKGEIKKINPMFMVFFSIMFTIALAGAWEIWEFTTDQLFGLDSQLNSLIDTMTDIICGTVGGGVALIPIYRFAKGKENRFLKTIINEVSEDNQDK